MSITKRRRAGVASAALTLAGLFMLAGPATVASAVPHTAHYGKWTCGSGIIRPGTYSDILIIGNCTLTDFGTVVINGSLRVASSATFNGVTNGTLIVYGSLYAGTDSVTDLGCNVVSVGPPCTTNSRDVVGGHVYIDNPLEVSFHNVSVGEWFKVWKWKTSNLDCSMTDATGTPDYMDFEDGSVGGNLIFQDLSTCWLGLFRTHVGGNVDIYNNRTNTTVPGIAFDSPELATNVIDGALNCEGNVPNPTFGDSHGKPNIARKGKHGQCKNL
jgi:hypothetical protein